MKRQTEIWTPMSVLEAGVTKTLNKLQVETYEKTNNSLWSTQLKSFSLRELDLALKKKKLD